MYIYIKVHTGGTGGQGPQGSLHGMAEGQCRV